MKHIIYLTTAMEQSDFNEYLKHWTIALNPSNQNFHNKLIRALSLTYKIDVISIRPFSKRYVDLKFLKEDKRLDGNITWYYPRLKRNSISKYIDCKKEVSLLLKELYDENSLILTDTINPSLSFFLSSLNKKKKYKTVGLVTDSPSNISNTGRSFTTYLLKVNQNHDGYIALTDELNYLYNPSGKPSIVLEGIVENPANYADKPLKAAYFFFGGALLERYGIYNLIDAFNEINKEYKDIKLCIAGHHKENDKFKNAISKNKNILFLGLLTKDQVLCYEQYAIANINPRPFSEDLDRYSIPSKTLEYLTSGKPTISVKNTKLGKLFYEDVIWTKSASKEDLYEGMLKVLTDAKLTKEIAKNAKIKVLDQFGFKTVNDKVSELIEKL